MRITESAPNLTPTPTRTPESLPQKSPQALFGELMSLIQEGDPGLAQDYEDLRYLQGEDKKQKKADKEKEIRKTLETRILKKQELKKSLEDLGVVFLRTVLDSSDNEFNARIIEGEFKSEAMDIPKDVEVIYIDLKIPDSVWNGNTDVKSQTEKKGDILLGGPGKAAGGGSTNYFKVQYKVTAKYEVQQNTLTVIYDTADKNRPRAFLVSSKDYDLIANTVIKRKSTVIIQNDGEAPRFRTSINGAQFTDETNGVTDTHKILEKLIGQAHDAGELFNLSPDLRPIGRAEYDALMQGQQDVYKQTHSSLLEYIKKQKDSLADLFNDPFSDIKEQTKTTEEAKVGWFKGDDKERIITQLQALNKELPLLEQKLKGKYSEIYQEITQRGNSIYTNWKSTGQSISEQDSISDILLSVKANKDLYSLRSEIEREIKKITDKMETLEQKLAGIKK